jgi:uncharacterized RDD family membrane protein YckC
MTQIPAGWYPDPAPGQPGEPPGQRYWDGTQWTEHVAPGAVQTAPYPTQYPEPYPGQYATYAGPAPATTPDGQPLSGWWYRVAAFLLDKLILTVLTLAVGFPFVLRIGHIYTRFMQQAQAAARNGSDPNGAVRLLQSHIAGPALVVALIGLVLGFAYHVGFLKWKQATPGKLALGLRVRLRETPGPMSLATCALRWLAQFGAVGLLQLLPVVALKGLVGLYPLLDDLWPLWDSKNQAVHDKVARTNVVRIRS